MIKREFAEKWIYKLKKYWLEKNIDGVCSLFTNTKFYQETPFIKPFLTIEEIKEEWYHVKNEEIHNIEINVLAIDGNTVIANWYLEQNNDVYDGIYQIMFNDKNVYILKVGKCLSKKLKIMDNKNINKTNINWDILTHEKLRF